MKKNLADWRKSITITTCDICGAEGLDEQPIDHYEHDSGWEVAGFDKKQWLSVKCPNPKCRYEWSLWKLENQMQRMRKVLKLMTAITKADMVIDILKALYNTDREMTNTSHYKRLMRLKKEHLERDYKLAVSILREREVA